MLDNGAMPEELPELLVRNVAAWRRWLTRHHGQEQGVWLVLAKKGTSEPTTLSYGEALEEALCQGWIDGQVRRRDEVTYRQRFTPRRARSQWSKNNVEKVGRLHAEGRMQPAGAAQVEQAKADGRLEVAYAGQASAELPEDLARAIAAVPAAQAMFDVLTSQNRYALIYRVGAARRADTRARRIAQFVDMLARGEAPYAQRRRPDGSA
jgi:uncharacterized protein YdeI (YjbR/CyaY-like superfamily)